MDGCERGIGALNPVSSHASAVVGYLCDYVSESF